MEPDTGTLERCIPKTRIPLVCHNGPLVCGREKPESYCTTSIAVINIFSPFGGLKPFEKPAEPLPLKWYNIRYSVFVSAIVRRVLERCADDLHTLERDRSVLEAIAPPFPRITYDDALTLIAERHHKGEIIGGVAAYPRRGASGTAHPGVRAEPCRLRMVPGHLRRSGSVPHSGFGMGIERCVAWIAGTHHVRETIPFPRMLYRLYP